MTAIQHPFSRVLLPLNADQLSISSVEYAAKLGELYGVTLTLLFVHEFAGHNAGPGFAVESTEQTAQRINQLVETEINPLLGGTPVDQVLIRTGKPADEIIAAADELDADLVVMGTRGKTGLQHMIMGSVTEKVVHLINRPVLAVPVR